MNVSKFKDLIKKSLSGLNPTKLAPQCSPYLFPCVCVLGGGGVVFVAWTYKAPCEKFFRVVCCPQQLNPHSLPLINSFSSTNRLEHSDKEGEGFLNQVFNLIFQIPSPYFCVSML